MPKYFLLFCLLCISAITGYSQLVNRYAFVVGCKDYLVQANSLKNPNNDAVLMGTTLRKCGFKVFGDTNTTKRRFDDLFNAFCANAQNSDVVVFYFSGHGAEIRGENYLFPTDANPMSETDVRYDCISVNRIIESLEEKKVKTKIILLDACRDNPFKKWNRSVGDDGLASVNVPFEGLFIGFAAAPGKTANDNPGGKNGLYTEAIAQFITEPNKTIDQVFTRVGAYVYTRSGRDQFPFRLSSVLYDFFFNYEPGLPAKTDDVSKASLELYLQDIFYGLTIGMPYQQALTYFGLGENSIPIGNMIAAPECAPNEIRYFWRFLKDFPNGREIEKQLNSIGLLDQTDLGFNYLCLFFKDNKLVKISLRLLNKYNPKQYTLTSFIKSKFNFTFDASDLYGLKKDNNFVYALSKDPNLNGKELLTFDILPRSMQKDCVYNWYAND